MSFDPALDLADLFALSFLRQHAIRVNQRPSKALLRGALRQAPDVRNATVSAAQVDILQFMMLQVPGIDTALAEWLSFLMDLSTSPIQPRYLSHGRYEHCLSAASLDPGCVLAVLPTPILYDICRHAGYRSRTNRRSERSQEQMAVLLEGSCFRTLQSYAVDTFGKLLGRWMMDGVPALQAWTIDIGLPSLLAKEDASNNNRYVALLILLGLYRQQAIDQNSGLSSMCSVILETPFEQSFVRFCQEQLARLQQQQQGTIDQ